MIRIVRRPDPSRRRDIVTRLAAVFAALVCASLIMAALGYNPVAVFSNIIVGSTGTAHRIRQTIVKAIPLTTLSLGVAVCFLRRAARRRIQAAKRAAQSLWI